MNKTDMAEIVDTNARPLIKAADDSSPKVPASESPKMSLNNPSVASDTDPSGGLQDVPGQQGFSSPSEAANKLGVSGRADP